jgi:hypothetical protein
MSRNITTEYNQPNDLPEQLSSEILSVCDEIVTTFIADLVASYQEGEGIKLSEAVPLQLLHDVVKEKLRLRHLKWQN